MKKNIIIYVSMLVMLFANSAFAQMGGGGHHMNPDSLQPITVSGIAIVDTTTMMHPIYFIDTDNNGEADYFLNFGPWWYVPDSSNATRPNNGDQITIGGGLWEENMMGYQMIVVYEINGEFWRDPYNPFWNNMGHHGANGGHHMDSCNYAGWGWQHDPPVTVTRSGYAIVDSTFMMEHYYLDEDNDGTPDYFLNFGPPWYEPNSGAHRPNNGDQIDIVGGLIENGNHSMIVVYEINGLFWRDSTFFGGHMGGGWMHRNMTQPKQFHTPFDEQDWIEMNPGWHHGGGGHHGGMQDSMFCQIFETNPGSMFTIGNENAFAGYEVDFFYSGMMGGGMHHGMGCNGHLEFESNADFQFHYTDEQINLRGINEQTIEVKYWDSDVNNWIAVSNAVINTSTNKVTFSNSKVGNFYILTGDSPTGLGNGTEGAVEQFSLEQNYPNPFNPSTSIRYTVPNTSIVNITVYNIVGQEITQLVNEFKQTGEHEITFNADELSSGIYLVRMQAGEYVSMIKMTLLK